MNWIELMMKTPPTPHSYSRAFPSHNLFLSSFFLQVMYDRGEMYSFSKYGRFCQEIKLNYSPYKNYFTRVFWNRSYHVYKVNSVISFQYWLSFSHFLMIDAHFIPRIMHKRDGEHINSRCMKGASYWAWLCVSPVFLKAICKKKPSRSAMFLQYVRNIQSRLTGQKYVAVTVHSSPMELALHIFTNSSQDICSLAFCICVYV